MRLFALLLLLSLATTVWAGSYPAQPGTVEYHAWSLRGITVHGVVCSPPIEAHIILARGSEPGKSWTAESFPSLVHRTGPRAAISGPYFDLDSLAPVCTLITNGRILANGLCCSYLVISEAGVAHVSYNPPGNTAAVQWPPHLPLALATGPILVRQHEAHANRRDEGFHDPGLFGSARRTAVGVTDAGKLVLAATGQSLNLETWACLLLDLGLRDALNLDGGTSAGFYGGGALRLQPGRALPTILLVE